MSKENIKSESLDRTQDKKAQPEKPEPVFATPEELAEKEQLLQLLKQIERDKSVEGLTKQKEILLQMEELDQRRKERIAGEKGEEIYDAEKGIFYNIRFKPGTDRRSGKPSYLSRHAGRPLVVLLGIQGPTPEIVPNKPYKARVEGIRKEVIYVRIIE